jgi:uncharacterized protein (TIGR02453 family)
MAFTGFGPEALPFFRAIGFHQNREWFQENRAIYERDVREPMLALLDELTARFEKDGIPLRGGPKSIFRINRDVRFSKDKRPYQTHCGAVMTRSGGKGDPRLLYIHIAPPMEGAPEGSFTALGFHNPDPAAMTAIRTAIRRDPTAWQKLVAALGKAKLTLGTGNMLTRVPRGFEEMKGTPAEEGVRLKSWVVEVPIAEADIGSKKLIGVIAEFARRGRPLLDFGWKAMG